MGLDGGRRRRGVPTSWRNLHGPARIWREPVGSARRADLETCFLEEAPISVEGLGTAGQDARLTGRRDVCRYEDTRRYELIGRRYLLAPWNFPEAFSSGAWTARTAPGFIGDER